MNCEKTQFFLYLNLVDLSFCPIVSSILVSLSIGLNDYRFLCQSLYPSTPLSISLSTHWFLPISLFFPSLNHSLYHCLSDLSLYQEYESVLIKPKNLILGPNKRTAPKCDLNWLYRVIIVTVSQQRRLGGGGLSQRRLQRRRLTPSPLTIY